MPEQRCRSFRRERIDTIATSHGLDALFRATRPAISIQSARDTQWKRLCIYIRYLASPSKLVYQVIHGGRRAEGESSRTRLGVGREKDNSAMLLSLSLLAADSNRCRILRAVLNRAGVSRLSDPPRQDQVRAPPATHSL